MLCKCVRSCLDVATCSQGQTLGTPRIEGFGKYWEILGGSLKYFKMGYLRHHELSVEHKVMVMTQWLSAAPEGVQRTTVL